MLSGSTEKNQVAHILITVAWSDIQTEMSTHNLQQILPTGTRLEGTVEMTCAL